MTRRLPAALVAAAVWTVVLNTSPASAASVPVLCPDGTVVTVEFGADVQEFTANSTAACAGHQGTSTDDVTPDDHSTASSNDGHWEWSGSVCDNGGICSGNLLCADGTPVQVFVFVHADGTHGESTNYCPGDPSIPTPDVPPTPDQIAEAFQHVTPPTARLSIQPPGGRTLVNLETVFSTQAAAFSTGRMPLVPGYTVEFHVRPERFTWTFGDGTRASTDWAGEPWSEGADLDDLITHVYARTGKISTSVAVEWSARASVNGQPAVPVEGTVTTVSDEVGLDVLEAEPQLVLE